ncbi:MAG: lipopolysaccharide export system protein LptA [Kiritimatiellia bacterium]|jgi:lipopolysaccharide export system protein LptA
MNLNRYHVLTTLFILSLSICAGQVIALADDKDQPINVSADKARKNDKQGLTVYQGDVVITQGSIRITGEIISIYDTAGTVDKIVATGKPAKFKQQPEPQSEYIIANGSTIEYDVKAESLLLLENALLLQEGNTTNSNKIIYDMKTAVVNAGDEKGRVIMTLKPSPTNP